MAETITVEIAIERLRQLTRRLPRLRRFLGQQVLLKVIERGLANIIGGVLPANGPNRALGRYYAATMRARVRDDGKTIYTGLPVADEAARILAFKNRGGTIYPKQDRPNPHLRIPLAPALTGVGFDRFQGVLLRKLPRGKNPFVIEKTGTGQAFLVKKHAFKIERDTKRAFAGVTIKGEARGKTAGERWYELVKSKYYDPERWWDQTTDETTQVLNGVLERGLKEFLLREFERKAGN